MLKDIPNILTILRILLIPILVLSFYLVTPLSRYLVIGIFVFASITDYFDGSLARKWNAETNFGRMLDPIADKMLVISTLIMLVDQKIAPVIPILAIVCREIFVSGMREYLATHNVTISVNVIGKLKTALQMTAIILLLLDEKTINIANTSLIGTIMLWAVAILTIISGYIYTKNAIRYVIESDNKTENLAKLRKELMKEE